MKWMEVHIDTSPAGLDRVSGLLEELGIEGLMIEDEGDFRSFLENNQQYWDYVDEALDESMRGKCRVTFYLEENEAGYTVLAQARIAISALKKEDPSCGPLLMTLENVADSDWENGWRAYYKPMEIGRRLLVVPDWEKADAGDRVALRLDPGLAFGTGSHATTRLCLEVLERRVRPGDRVLDLGCGSGILSIAALLLGAGYAFACDIDEKAVGVAYSNAALNQIDKERYTVRAGDVLGDAGLQREMGAGYDLVIANIVADVILALAPAVQTLMKEEGAFLCSGIIDTRTAEVRAGLLSSGLTILEERQDQGWSCFLCQKETAK